MARGLLYRSYTIGINCIHCVHPTLDTLRGTPWQNVPRDTTRRSR
ncbi:MAG: hypothetical protein NTZ37_07585 [Methanoregula sp.]|nr:hypothetical protein [Methanoregula sp.]